MVRYNSKEWFKNFKNFYKSWTLQVIMRTTFVMGALTAGICVLFMEVVDYDFNFNVSIFSLLGVTLSILLVFRTNTAYDRWWEGRKQWGALVNHCRTLSIGIHAVLPEEDRKSRFFFAKNIANFCISLKEHLRDGTKIEELIHLSEKEKEELAKKQHVPNYIAYCIYKHLQNIFKSNQVTEADMINLKPNIQALVDILGACERIKKTPIPFSYNVYIKTFVLLYCLILPFGLIHLFGYYTIPMVMFIFFTMIGLELIAEEIEDPFGLDCNDLPTGTLAHTIKNNVFEIMEFPEEVDEKEGETLYTKIF